MGLIPAINVLGGKEYMPVHFNWNMIYGSFSVGLDGLSAFFLLIILSVSLLAAIFGSRYLYQYVHEKKLGVSWFFFNILVFSMALVVIAQDSILFLIAWEIMSLSSFFLVTFDNKKEEVKKAGYIYFLATHLSTVFLLIFFLLLDHFTGSLQFTGTLPHLNLSLSNTNLLFLFGFIGFGIKAGFVPFHIWLPEAHPAAPSNVSAVMSGVMIKTGIYGLIRVLMLLGTPMIWWAWLIIIVGFLSGVLGVLFAIAQHDLKRLLAYHSVENIGIILLGMGLGLLGICYQSSSLMLLGFLGCLLHILNHAVFKSLLFLGAGSVLHATGVKEINRLGGLIKQMPITAAVFLIGAVAISGLPPLNGFISEFLIYLGAFKGTAGQNAEIILPALIIIIGLTTIGGLAALCFTKVVGCVFLGQSRSSEARAASETGYLMLLPMIILAGGCFVISLCSHQIIKWVVPIVTQITGLETKLALDITHNTADILSLVVWIFACFIGIVLVISFLRKSLIEKQEVDDLPTWGCGYKVSSPRFQYTASSFAQPLIKFFGVILRKQKHLEYQGVDLFPKKTSFKTHTKDVFMSAIYYPLFKSIKKVLSGFLWLQYGRIHLYVLYVALTIIGLLIWYIGLS